MKTMKKSQEILDKHLENSDVKHILEKYSVAYNACLDAIDEAINYSPCCKSDSEQLNNLKNKLSFRQWKEVNNYRLTGNDLIRKGKLTFTAAEVFKQYKKYVNEIV